MTHVSRLVAVTVITLHFACGTTAAQQRILLFGTVQWTSTNRVQLMTDSGASISLDVSGLDQTSYTNLRTGDRIRVDGYVAPERNRVIAESLVPDVWGFPQTS